MIESVEILVVKNTIGVGEQIFYCGDSEIEAFRKSKTLTGGKINIYKAKVWKKELLKNIPFIMKYEVLETIE